MSPASLYLLLWTLGCAAGFVSAVVVLHRRHALTAASAGAVALAWLFLFIGSKWHSRLEHLPWTQALLVTPAELFAPGRRLPLGLLTSGAAAVLACLVLRLPWRDVGDALAVFWSVLIPIGRVGCMLYGCCLGTVCPPWLRPIGWRYGPGTEAFHLQLAAGIISPASTLSLPVHPLPLYFALASVGTLAVLVWLLRRAAPPGILLLTFCLLRPATKLALEPLRAEPALPWLMIGIPAITLAVAIAVAVPLLLRRVRIARGRRLAAATLLPLVLLALTARLAHSGEPPWTTSLQKYAQNPLRNRRLLRRLEREGRDHSPVVLLALADARLRSGSFAAAERLFARASTATAEESLATWAVLGRAWAGLLAGDTPEVGDAGTSPVAVIMQGLAQQRSDEAERIFARVTGDGRASSGLRAAAQLALAYARYWAREDDAGTIAGFDDAVALADGRLVDDARYGAARARLRAGDPSATPILHDLATWHTNGRPGPTSPALVALEREALLRAGFVRYRRGAVRTPEDQLHVMLDGDGAALARAALRELGESVPEPRPAPRPRARREPAPERPASPVVHVPIRTHASQRSHPSLDTISAWLRRVLVGAAVLAALLIAHTWWWDRCIPRGGRHGPRT